MELDRGGFPSLHLSGSGFVTWVQLTDARRGPCKYYISRLTAQTHHFCPSPTSNFDFLQPSQKKSNPRSHRPTRQPCPDRTLETPHLEPRDTNLPRNTMAKAQRQKRNGAQGGAPYQRPAGKAPIFKFNTKIGQHILKNAAIADAIVAKANIQPVETVLEIGPGTGVLTTRILEHARSVIAVELDPRMAAELSCKVQGTPQQRKLEVIMGDFIKVPNEDIKPFDVCISNTPYQVRPRTF